MIHHSAAFPPIYNQPPPGQQHRVHNNLLSSPGDPLDPLGGIIVDSGHGGHPNGVQTSPNHLHHHHIHHLNQPLPPFQAHHHNNGIDSFLEPDFRYPYPMHNNDHLDLLLQPNPYPPPMNGGLIHNGAPVSAPPGSAGNWAGAQQSNSSSSSSSRGGEENYKFASPNSNGGDPNRMIRWDVNSPPAASNPGNPTNNTPRQTPQVFVPPDAQQFRAPKRSISQGSPQVPLNRAHLSNNEPTDDTEGQAYHSGSGYSSYESSGEDAGQEDLELLDSPATSGIIPLSLQHFPNDNKNQYQQPPFSPNTHTNITLASNLKGIQPPSLPQIEDTLRDLAVVVKTVEDTLSKIDIDIKNSALPMPLESSTTSNDYLRQLQQTLELNLEHCHEIKNQHLLHCKHLFELNERYKGFIRLMLQIEIFRKEIEHCMASADYGDVIFAALFINQQPFPATIKQHLLVDTIRVQILTGARTRVDLSVPVKAEMITDWNIGNNKKQSTPMKGHEERFSPDGTASFRALKFTVGTGCKAVQIKFRTLLNKKNQKFQFESDPSECFIVMTNTKQWAEAQGILTKRELFKEASEVSAQYFANIIQMLYIQASRQDPRKASRPLGPLDFQFLFLTKVLKPFSYHQIVTQADFDRLWSWFGPVLQKIRYQKFLLPMWTGGLFWGFISKNESEQVLEPYDAGTFILRFSERMNNGSMAVAYKQSQNAVRHYLIKSKDTSGQGHSLPQFIRDTSSLLQFLRITITEGFELKFSVIEKNQALAKIGSKRRKTADNKGSGYDEYLFDLVDAATKNWQIN